MGGDSGRPKAALWVFLVGLYYASAAQGLAIGYSWVVGALRAVILSRMHGSCKRVAPPGGLRRCSVLAVMGATGALPLAGARAQTPVPVDTVALVRRAVELRLQEEKSHRPVRYVLRKVDGDHETTKEIVETKDGDVARLVAINGQPLSAEQERVEMERLDVLAAHPELEERRRRSEQRDAARIDRLVGMLPDAEVYTLLGMVPCGAGSGTGGGFGGQCYRLGFAPNPGFAPPDIEAEVLQGFAGEVWIDKEQNRLVRLDARLVRDVNIGFGILGRVNKGGTMALDQAYASDAREWQPTVLKINLQGRALMVKAVDIRIDELASGFAPVPEGTGYREGIAMLKRVGMFGAQQAVGAQR
jgi:hypothetical protein